MMNQIDILKKVGVILNELRDQYDFLAQNPEQLNELELELFNANVNFLSDHVEIVRKINLSKPKTSFEQFSGGEMERDARVITDKAPVIEDVPQPKDYNFFEKPVQLAEFLNDEEKPDLKNPAEPSPVEHTFEFALSERPSQVSSALPAEDLEEEKTSNFPAATPLKAAQEVEVKQEELIRPTLNDMLGSKKPVAEVKIEKKSQSAIASLKGAITLNEKLLFIKNLFNGYNLAYSEAIDLIDKMPDLRTADAFLKANYAEKNNWQLKQGTVDQFYNLLKQRFPNG